MNDLYVGHNALRRPRGYRLFVILLGFTLALNWTAITQLAVRADVPAGYIEFYIPGSADQLFQIFQDIDNDPNLSNDPNDDGDGMNDSNQMHVVISVALTTANTTVYYDHWENGYGDGSIGIDETYSGGTGTVMIFESGDMLIPRAALATCTSKNPSNPTMGASRPCYDGRDRIYVAGGAVTVSTTSWPEVTDTVFAQGYEIYPVKPYMTNYTVPIGENLAASPPTGQNYEDFNQTFIMVQAAYDNTSVQINDPRSPDPEIDVILNRGEVTQYFHNYAGTTITGSDPIQVQMVVGQAHPDLYSESRDYTLVPAGLWHTAYYNPVPSFTATYDTEIYIYNPTPAPLEIRYEDSSGSNTFNVPASSTRSFTALAGHTLPIGSGLYLEAVDGVTKFWAIGSAGTLNSTGNSNADYDYGFSLVPANLLKQEYFLSWAPGSSRQPAPTENGSPVFVTPVEDDTTVFVDYSPVNGTIDATYTLDRIQIQKIFDPDFDNTAMHLWSTAPIAVVWGEDASTAAIGNPYIDTGYSSLPLPEEWIDPVLTIDKSADPETVGTGAGQTSTFTLVTEAKAYPIEDVIVTDVLPASWSYVPGSTVITLPDLSTISGTAADPDIASQTLTWDEFPTQPLDMSAGQKLTITFQGITSGTPALGYSINTAATTGRRGTQTFEATDTATIYITELGITKASDAGGSTHPGDVIHYTVVLDNQGLTMHHAVTVDDPLPEGTSYVAGSSRVTGYKMTPATVSYEDQFNARLYSNSNGSHNWATNWVEEGETTDPTAGAAQVLTDGAQSYVLRPGDNPANNNNVANRSVYRTADLSICSSATLEYLYRRDNLDTDDTVYVEARRNPSSAWASIAQITTATSGYSDSAYQSITPINLSAYLSTTTGIRFRTNFSEGGSANRQTDRVFFDNIRINCQTQIKIPVTQAAGALPNLVPEIEGFVLDVTDTMTITYDVIVSDPLPAGVASIDNTASAISAESLEPRQASVSDDLPLSLIGDHLWLDVDGDGVDDIGEPGLANVTVHLYSPGPDGVAGGGDDLQVATTTSDANGDYLFEAPAGEYYVQTGSGIPSGLSLSPGSFSPTVVFASTAAQSYLEADFGYRNPSTATAIIGDTVWSDADGDGLQDPGEPGLDGVTLELHGPGADGILGTGDDAIAAIATTASDGIYHFNNVPTGEYIVVVTDASGVLAGCTPTSGPHSLGGFSSNPIAVTGGDVFLNADFGFQPPAGQNNAIGDLVWHDRNGNGGRDAGEPGLSGISVSLLNNSGNVIASTQTTADGSYSFNGVPDGLYTVWVNDHGGQLPGFAQTYDPDESAPCASCDDRDNNIDLDSAGANNTGVVENTADFGYNLPGAIGDTVFSDADGDGLQNPGEPGISGVTVQLYRDDGDGVFEPGAGDTLVKTSVASSTGEYQFGRLDAYTYWVSVNNAQPALSGYAHTTVDAHTGTPDSTEIMVSLPTGGSYLNADFGYKNNAQYSIGDTVWHDADGDGLQGAGETGIPNVTLALYKDANGNGILDSGEALIAATTTDTIGQYGFDGLPNGNYLVAVTDQNAMLTGYLNTHGLDIQTAVLNNADNLNIDFGYDRDLETAAIGDRVWYDTDGDGLQDVTEAGIANVQISLWRDSDGDGSGDILVDMEYTGSDGGYLFDRLPAGKYIVETASANFDPGGALENTLPTVPGGNQHPPIDLSQGENYLKADFGYRGAGYSLGDYVWSDTDNDGLQDPGEPGIPGVTVELVNNAGDVLATTVSRFDGRYLFADLPAGEYRVRVPTINFNAGGPLENYQITTGPQSVGSNISSRLTLNASNPAYSDLDFGYLAAGLGEIGDYVWLDKDMDGEQEAGEPGLGSVTLDLVWDLNGDGVRDPGEPIVAHAFTDDYGNYRFTGLDVDDGGGDAAYLVIGTDENKVLEGMTLTSGSASPRSVTLTPVASSQLDVDFGYDDPMLGDFVWHDADGDGLQNAAESGIQGVEVLLYRDVNHNGVVDSGVDNLIQTTTTNIEGFYYFSGLPFEEFVIKVADTNFLADGVLSAFAPAPANSGGDEAVDSDANAVHEIAVTPLTAKDFTQDFGFVAPVGYTIGNQVWEDVTVDGYYNDVLEDGIGGVNIDLYRDTNGNGFLDSTDLRIGSTVTLADGTYQFTNIPNGAYLVHVADRSGRLVDYTWVDGQDNTDNYSQYPIYAVTVNNSNVSFADSGYRQRPEFPTSVKLANFMAIRQGAQVRLSWETILELDAAGFNLYRSTNPDGEQVLVNNELIACSASGSVGGAAYEFTDLEVEDGQTYYYWLEFLDGDGITRLGPRQAVTTIPLYLPLVIH